MLDFPEHFFNLLGICFGSGNKLLEGGFEITVRIYISQDLRGDLFFRLVEFKKMNMPLQIIKETLPVCDQRFM